MLSRRIRWCPSAALAIDRKKLKARAMTKISSLVRPEQALVRSSKAAAALAASSAEPRPAPAVRHSLDKARSSSIRSKISFPWWSFTIRPRRAPMARMSARRGASLSKTSVAASAAGVSPSKRVPGSAKLDDRHRSCWWSRRPLSHGVGGARPWSVDLAAKAFATHRGVMEVVEIVVVDVDDGDKIRRAESRPVDNEEDRSMVSME
mmetsp:Transcript_25731/g.60334  ORF Transcript_25731/g.60334 Transcript_25731/m.60334 type:complete len:206 (-) Transcript_25731:171-788(-)